MIISITFDENVVDDNTIVVSTKGTATLGTTINGATDCIVNITGGETMTLFEAEDAVEVVRAVANTDVNVIFGAVINEALTDEIVVTVIATGFEDSTEPLYRSMEGEKKSPINIPDEDEELEMPAFLRNRDF